MITITKDGALGLVDALKIMSHENPPISLLSPKSSYVNWQTIESTLDLGNRYLHYDNYIKG